jgi:hypothetical protein
MAGRPILSEKIKAEMVRLVECPMSLLNQFLDALGIRIENREPRYEQRNPQTLFDQLLSRQLRDQNRSKGNAPCFNDRELRRFDD